MINWKIYYANGSTFTSAQGTIAQAPKSNVIMTQHRIHDPNTVGTIVSNTSQADYYLWDPVVGEFLGLDSIGVIDAALDAGHITQVNPNNPTTYTTPAGVFDFPGLIFWLSNTIGFIFRGRFINRQAFYNIKSAAYADEEIREPDQIKQLREFPPLFNR